MTVNFTTDLETDRLLSMRASANVPFPPEISLAEPRDSRSFYGWLFPYRLLGLEDHPVIRFMEQFGRERMTSSAVAKAEHLDRVSHYGAWLGKSTVSIVDLTHPTEDDLKDDGVVGDLSDMDWEKWTMDRLYKDLRTRYWGGVSRKSIVNIDIYREYKIRVCKECGCLLRTYDGFTDFEGQFVRYIADHPIVAFRNNADLVNSSSSDTSHSSATGTSTKRNWRL